MTTQNNTPSPTTYIKPGLGSNLPAHVIPIDAVGNDFQIQFEEQEDGTYTVLLSIEGVEVHPNTRGNFPQYNLCSFQRMSRQAGTGKVSMWPQDVIDLNHPEYGTLRVKLRLELVAESLEEVEARIADSRAKKAAAAALPDLSKMNPADMLALMIQKMGGSAVPAAPALPATPKVIDMDQMTPEQATKLLEALAARETPTA